MMVFLGEMMVVNRSTSQLRTLRSQFKLEKVGERYKYSFPMAALNGTSTDGRIPESNIILWCYVVAYRTPEYDVYTVHGQIETKSPQM
jgi:hypothetical protein